MTSILKESLLGKVLQDTNDQGAQIISIAHKTVSASVSLYGGQVLSWQPTGQEPVFWMSKTASFEQGKAIRGGIPLCWPWFGGYKDGGNHGFARTQMWQLNEIVITEDGIELMLSWQGENIHQLWPQAARLTQRLFFGSSFSQTLAMENLSNVPVQYTGALHSYFNVSQPNKVSVEKLNGVPFDCKLSGDKKITDSLANMQGPIDRVYYTNEAMEINDAGFARKLIVTGHNTHQWVLWNPGLEIAQSMADLHAGGENEYFCLEAASTEWQTIAPKQRASMSQRIEIRTL